MLLKRELLLVVLIETYVFAALYNFRSNTESNTHGKLTIGEQRGSRSKNPIHFLHSRFDL